MDFPTAVRTCLTKYADFSDRARRAEFWWFVLFIFLLGIVAGILDGILGTDFDDVDSGLITTVVNLALAVPSLAVGARRLHDTGRSGWWQLLTLIPVVGWIILIVWFASNSEPGANRFGSNPKDGGWSGQGYGPGYGQSPA